MPDLIVQLDTGVPRQRRGPLDVRAVGDLVDLPPPEPLAQPFVAPVRIVCLVADGEEILFGVLGEGPRQRIGQPLEPRRQAILVGVLTLRRCSCLRRCAEFPDVLDVRSQKRLLMLPDQRPAHLAQLRAAVDGVLYLGARPGALDGSPGVGDAARHFEGQGWGHRLGHIDPHIVEPRPLPVEDALCPLPVVDQAHGAARDRLAKGGGVGADPVVVPDLPPHQGLTDGRQPAEVARAGEPERPQIPIGVGQLRV